jgi:heme oxygenase (biliverdin-producing, ferredoxin)
LETELRGAAMRLHTREQAPKEGQAPAPPRAPYTPTHADYLAFLVDSLHVYEAFEAIIAELASKEAGATAPNGDTPTVSMKALQHTGLERTAALRQDIDWMVQEYTLERPSVGAPGLGYAQHLRELSYNIPKLICHYYNFYFAHTAGGRMIGKQMSALLLNKKTLEFYKVRSFYVLL